MAFQNQTYANSGSAYYGHPADWSKYSTINDVILFNDTEAKIEVFPAIPDSATTIAFNGNQLAYLSDIPDLGNWAQYPANNDVLIDAPYVLRADTGFISTLTVYSQTTQNEVNVSSFVTSTLTVTENAYISTASISSLSVINSIEAPLLKGSTISILADNQNFPLQLPSLNITSKNGLGGRVTVTADSGTGFVGGGLITLDAKGGTGLLGLNGAINMIAESGSSAVLGVTTGGRIDITANSGINDVSLTSAVKISGAGVNIQSGITSPIASVAGYTFIGGNLGVNSCAGIPPIIPNVPGTNYIYGTLGIELNSDVYTTDVYPYFDGLTNPDDLTINGRTVDIGLGPYNAMVELNNIKNLSFETAPSFRTGGAITGLSSINGLNSGPAGAIQYSDGLGAFQGNSGLKYDGVSRITNSNGNNFIDINETANANSIAIQSSEQQVNITAGDILGLTGISQVYLTAGSQMRIDINGSTGTPGQVLTSDGTFTTWQDPPQPFQATYYNTIAENLTSGNSDITFDSRGSWANEGGYIEHIDGTKDFTVQVAGLYQLEFNVVVSVNGAIWATTINRTCNIDILRPSLSEVGILTTTGLQGVQNYGQSINGTYYLLVGDVLNMRVGNIFTGGPAQALGIQNTFDLNTFFTWTYIAVGSL